MISLFSFSCSSSFIFLNDCSLSLHCSLFCWSFFQTKDWSYEIQSLGAVLGLCFRMVALESAFVHDLIFLFWFLQGDYEENLQHVGSERDNESANRYWCHEVVVLVLFVMWHALLLCAFALNTRHPCLEWCRSIFSVRDEAEANRIALALIIIYIAVHLILLILPYSVLNMACVRVEKSQNGRRCCHCKLGERPLMGTSCPFLHRKILWDIARSVCCLFFVSMHTLIVLNVIFFFSCISVVIRFTHSTPYLGPI